MARDTRLRVAFVVLVAAALGVLVLTMRGPKTENEALGSSFGARRAGAKAAYLLLGKLGHDVERRIAPLGDLGEPRLAFVLAPEGRLDQMDTAALVEWIEGGGALVYGVSAFEVASHDLRAALGIDDVGVRYRWDPERARLDAGWAPVAELSVNTLLSPDAEHRAHVIARGEEGAAALAIPRGDGWIYVVDAAVFSNGGLATADNALFLAALAARHAGGEAVLFDEFVHGYGDAAAVLGGVAWPLRAAFGLGALALLVYALAIGRRLGPPSPEPVPPRRASIEQIEALGAYFAGSRDRASALAALAAFTGAPPPAPPGDDRTFLAAARAIVSRPAPPPHAKGSTWP